MTDYASPTRRFEGPRHTRKACAVIMAVTLLCGASLASAAIDKNATYQQMLSLAQQMNSLKPQVRTNAQAATAYATAEGQYRSLSAAMGGDDPGHVGGAASAATAARRVPRKVVPTTPAGCGQTTTNFTQSTPVAIPTGPAVVTSTIVVSGVGSYLFDLDATTFIQHTFSADLDITITSPAGTVVTLTTDNGGSNDNVFNGTLWDDDANPGGQVPYTTNNGLVTDQLYANLTTATPLVPEEAMGAFIGEDPNGTWTITISDDLAGDGGSLDSWSLAVTTFPNAPITTTVPTATQSTPVAIPTGPAVVTSTIVISGAGTSILDVDAITNIMHTFSADLDITLTSPAGTVVTLTTDNGAGNDNVFNGTLWDDDANPGGQVPYTTNNGLVTDQLYANLTTATPLVPEEAMAAFIGEDPNGTWTLTVSDDLAGDGGSIDSWSLDIDTFSCASSDLSITKTDGVTTVAPGGSTTYTIVASNAGPTAANPATVTDIFPAACTSVTYTSTAAGGATGNTAAGSGNISDAALNLPAGSSVTYTATCTLSPGASGTLVNTATVASGTPDPNTADNNATDTDTFSAASADLSLTKTLTTPAPIHVGDNVTFALTVTNNGPANATGVTVTDTLPAGLAYVSNDCGAVFANPTLTWSVGALAVTASATCHLTATVTQTGTITNTASATGNESDPTPANNAGQAPISGQPAAIIPTLDSVGLAALAILLAVSAAFALRRKRRV
ncbi:MAG: proprotein convertase P-domain-containing protein [Thermoanaerobaculia bacterium]